MSTGARDGTSGSQRPRLWALTVAAIPVAGVVGYGLWKLKDDPVIKYEAEQNMSEVEHEPLIDDDDADAGFCRQSSECHPHIVYTSTGDRLISSGRYCQKPAGDCDGRGKCEWNPTVMFDHRSPICGCDGKTYVNATQAASRGINIAHDGECPGNPIEWPRRASREFDQKSVLVPLSEAARTAGENCYRPKSRTNRGHAIVTFEPNGHVSSVDITGDLSGTSVGNCVRRHFQAVVVPPFDGTPVSVGKAFFLGPVVQP